MNIQTANLSECKLLLVQHSDGCRWSIIDTFYHSNSKLFVRYSRHGLNNGPFDKRTVLDHLNTKIVRYADAHCTLITEQQVKYSNGQNKFSCQMFGIKVMDLNTRLVF